ncbi:hypothetical protein SmJEL517_g00555 [Synchytrium microbalum]|uniref:GH26 domain-containing protein n=1 Tax=Synchytrium microbalum TaxID=1806994 RepID=A0A507CHT8_9FUNG|nr:uncharacterized protein SmJEL517_g00555 [Synchytrium microbalum]TPX37686.1 hypothetical protein SmJEL517_g00555 [Synchytrium microbalum]
MRVELGGSPASRVQQLLEPETGVYIAVWTDSYPYVNTSSNDTPKLLNDRTGKKWSLWHIGQNIPAFSANSNTPNVDTTVNETLLELTNTDAGILLDVFPFNNAGTSYSAISANDIQALANQCAAYNKKGRKVWLRLASEMNGNWYPYAQQPASFVQLWINVTNAVRAVAPSTAMLWSPQILPNGQYSLNPDTTGPINAANMALLDTNHDGNINSRDDPYTPYWPGTQYVDWIGTSMYYHGPYLDSSAMYGINSIPPQNYFDGLMNTANFPFYNFVASMGKPLSLSEWGIPFYIALTPDGPSGQSIPVAVGPGQVAMKRAWWTQSMTNKTIYAKYPLIKMWGLFEFIKDETGSFRDFQFLNTTTLNGSITNAFLSDLQTSGINFIWANDTSVSPNSTNTTITGNTTTAAATPAASSPPSNTVLASIGYVLLPHKTFWLLLFAWWNVFFLL